MLYGPAYGAEFLLAKTEDITREVRAEEDDWVAGVEWGVARGATVVSSSLAYSDWYTPTHPHAHSASHAPSRSPYSRHVSALPPTFRLSLRVAVPASRCGGVVTHSPLGISSLT